MNRPAIYAPISDPRPGSDFSPLCKYRRRGWKGCEKQLEGPPKPLVEGLSLATTRDTPGGGRGFAPRQLRGLKGGARGPPGGHGKRGLRPRCAPPVDRGTVDAEEAWVRRCCCVSLSGGRVEPRLELCPNQVWTRPKMIACASSTLGELSHGVGRAAIRATQSVLQPGSDCFLLCMERWYGSTG
ncbi:hypothetical protein NDU88_003040 [Pleurodeles waltl]|uniref:Uncharacterized protein n=1 Tax=Pleurodeles waltl TaxID=8319 RepID=A0AAV7QEM1_PLEWA|nr:hypothetical protein NDU88_003040 [Pleurodeles waltl]